MLHATEGSLSIGKIKSKSFIKIYLKRLHSSTTVAIGVFASSISALK
jgi:hypothetical protein